MIHVATLDGAITNVGLADISALRNGLRGCVILAGDPDYESAHRVWNGNVDRRPALIARCVDTNDVRQVVTFARGPIRDIYACRVLVTCAHSCDAHL
jgi:hypothetical protein